MKIRAGLRYANSCTQASIPTTTIRAQTGKKPPYAPGIQDLHNLAAAGRTAVSLHAGRAARMAYGMY